MDLESRQLHRRLATATIANETEVVQEVIDEIGSPELLAKIVRMGVLGTCRDYSKTLLKTSVRYLR